LAPYCPYLATSNISLNKVNTNYSLRSKEKLVAEKRRETHFLSNEENEKWIEDYVERETAGARK